MEAASARYATRDRFGAFGEPAQTQLQRFIRKGNLSPSNEHYAKNCLENAVDPQNFEANLALDLEIADLINSKKGNAYGTTTLYQPYMPNRR